MLKESRSCHEFFSLFASFARIKLHAVPSGIAINLQSSLIKSIFNFRKDIRIYQIL